MHKNYSKKPSGGARGEVLATKFELDITLIACMTSTVMGSLWYLHLGALFFMTRCQYFFNSLEEKNLQMHIELGGDGWYSTKGIGIVTFKWESGSHLHLKYIMYVFGLKKNLIFVVVLEDKGYGVVFSKWKSFLRHLSTGKMKHIGDRVKNIYKLEVEACATLSRKEKEAQSQDVGEIWHKHMGHLHHGALKIMQHITTGLPKCILAQHDVCKGCTLGKYVKSTFQG